MSYLRHITPKLFLNPGTFLTGGFPPLKFISLITHSAIPNILSASAPGKSPWMFCGTLVALFNKQIRKGGDSMLNWSLTFLVVGLIAGLLGLSGLAGTATQIAWILFVVFLILYLVSLVAGRRGIKRREELF
jgi:uncharacterized membrane protein YtjA (UPF0391 family)